MSYISLHSNHRTQSPVLFATSVHDAIVQAYDFKPVADEMWTVTDGDQAYSFNTRTVTLGTALDRSRIQWTGSRELDMAAYFGVPQRPNAVGVASRFAAWTTVAAGCLLFLLLVVAGV